MRERISKNKRGREKFLVGRKFVRSFSSKCVDDFP